MHIAFGGGSKTSYLTAQGSALGVDLGGTNLRVCLVEFHGDASYHAVYSKKSIPPPLMVAREAAELFAFIADQIETLLRAHRPQFLNGSDDIEAINLGLTFSFPVYQNAIDSGILLRWTKGFNIPSVVGKDVCKLLQHQMDLRKLPVKVTALINDAAGTIMCRAYSLPVSRTRTTIGTIFGTGTNGVYLEKLSNISKSLNERFDHSTGEMFISIEWGSFDNDLSVLPNTDYDEEINQASVNPGNQMFEKRVSGMFLGELLRTVVVKMHADPTVRLFQGTDSKVVLGLEIEKRVPLYSRWAVDSSILSIAESDNTKDMTILRRKIVDVLGIQSSLVDIEDARVVKIIAHAIGKRAARLSGMALAAVILKTKRLADTESLEQNKQPLGLGKDDSNKQTKDIDEFLQGDVAKDTAQSTASDEPCLIDIGVDGSVIEFYPHFETYMREALRAVAGIGTAGDNLIRMGLAKDGSSVGAAITALIATQQV